MPKKSVGIKVRKINAGKTIVIANKLELVDKVLEIQKDRNFVYVPLTHQPSEDELEEFRSQVADAKVSNYSFEERVRRVATLAELLAGKLAPHIIAALPHSADIVGSIAIIELSPELESHQDVIGNAILKLNKNVRTVLAKASAVSGTYRLRELRVIAGEPNTVTIHREYGCKYYVDLAKAYFSPRLSYEHHRVASLIREGETVIDLFAGVGPFAIQIARAREDVKIYAVDANPYAIEFLKKNVRLNRVENKVSPILGDAAEVVGEKMCGIADRVIMNLPEKAIEFVCASCKALRPAGGVIHFYGFAKASEPLESMEARFAGTVEQCGRKVEKVLFSRLVRATAPYEWQFVLDAQII